MKFDITKVVEEIAMQVKENQEEFIFETIRPYCENILQIKISKEELKRVLLNGMQKQQPCDDYISRAYIEPIVEELENICIDGDEYILSLLSNIKNAPSVTPQQKIGHWIDIETLDSAIWHECSECGETEFYATDYCPNCGAKMEVEE